MGKRLKECTLFVNTDTLWLWAVLCTLFCLPAFSIVQVQRKVFVLTPNKIEALCFYHHCIHQWRKLWLGENRLWIIPLQCLQGVSRAIFCIQGLRGLGGPGEEIINSSRMTEMETQHPANKKAAEVGGMLPERLSKHYFKAKLGVYRQQFSCL